MPAPSKTFDFKKMQSVFFFILLFLLGVVVLYLVRPFLYPIFWAAVIAVMFHPVYRWLLGIFKRPSLSSGITVLLALIVLFLPLMILSLLIVQKSTDLYRAISDSHFYNGTQDITTRLHGTMFEPYIEKIKTEWTSYAATAARSISVFLFENIKNITQNSVKFIFMLFLMVYSLFYFFKDGKRMLKRLMYLSPLGDTYESMLYERFTSTTRATLKSTIIVGGIQGLIGGILFWATGIEGAFIWGVIMTLASIIPALGAFVVWLPAGLIMLAMGNFWQGIAILGGGMVISLIDNFLRPPLIGKDTQMHPLLVLFSTLGGIFLFGISGFIIGPVVMALFLSVMSMYDHYYRTELKKN